MTTQTPRTALWPTLLGALVLVPFTIGLQRLAYYMFRYPLVTRLLDSGHEMSQVATSYAWMSGAMALGALLGAALAALVGPHAVSLMATLGLLLTLGMSALLPDTMLLPIAYAVAGLHGAASACLLGSLATLTDRSRPMFRYAVFALSYGLIHSSGLFLSASSQLVGDVAWMSSGVGLTAPLAVATLLIAAGLGLWWKGPSPPRSPTPLSLPVLVGGAAIATAAATLLGNASVIHLQAFHDYTYTLQQPWQSLLTNLQSVTTIGCCWALFIGLLVLARLRYRLPLMPLVAVGLMLKAASMAAGAATTGSSTVVVVICAALADAVCLPLLYARAGADLHWRVVSVPYALLFTLGPLVWALSLEETSMTVAMVVLLVIVALLVGIGGTLLELRADGAIRLQRT